MKICVYWSTLTGHLRLNQYIALWRCRRSLNTEQVEYPSNRIKTKIWKKIRKKEPQGKIRAPNRNAIISNPIKVAHEKLKDFKFFRRIENYTQLSRKNQENGNDHTGWQEDHRILVIRQLFGFHIRLFSYWLYGQSPWSDRLAAKVVSKKQACRKQIDAWGPGAIGPKR